LGKVNPVKCIARKVSPVGHDMDVGREIVREIDGLKIDGGEEGEE
jgi:hypothetical protein